MNKDNIDLLKGKGKTNTRESYFKDSRYDIKNEYLLLINRISILN